MVTLIRLLQNGTHDHVTMDPVTSMKSTTSIGGAATLFQLRKFTINKGNARSFALVGYTSEDQNNNCYLLFFGYKKGTEKNCHKLPSLQHKKNPVHTDFYGDIIVATCSRYEKISLDSLLNCDWKPNTDDICCPNDDVSQASPVLDSKDIGELEEETYTYRGKT